MRIAILDFCIPDPVFDSLGSVADMTKKWIAPHLPEATFEEVHIAGGAAFPALDDFDGYMLSGSEKGVYDDTPWMEPLRAFLRAARDRRKPMFGICFGHQIMADAFGGRAEKADKGFVIGARRYEIDGETVAAHAVHQDQVTQVPPGAEVTGSAPYCPVAALAYDFPARSIQFHPEYPSELIGVAIEAFDGGLLTAEDAAAGRASMEGAEVSDDLYGPEAARFFREAIEAAAAPA